jgi:hypothetical protein|tara:strand:- start:543 stop:902 length:360 start_codon:yes stop_codon:yes gene_type:complete
MLVVAVYITNVQLETNDSVCASCYVEPETSYYQARQHPKDAVTPAAFHRGEHISCIDCPDRPGIHAVNLWLMDDEIGWEPVFSGLVAVIEGRVRTLVFSGMSTGRPRFTDCLCSLAHGE